MSLSFMRANKYEDSELKRSPLKDHPYVRSFNWTFNSFERPELYFHRRALFDHVINE